MSEVEKTGLSLRIGGLLSIIGSIITFIFFYKNGYYCGSTREFNPFSDVAKLY